MSDQKLRVPCRTFARSVGCSCIVPIWLFDFFTKKKEAAFEMLREIKSKQEENNGEDGFNVICGSWRQYAGLLTVHGFH